MKTLNVEPFNSQVAQYLTLSDDLPPFNTATLVVVVVVVVVVSIVPLEN